MEDFLTMAQAVGEEPIGSPAFVAGEDFDPSDYDEVEIVREASARHGRDTISRLEHENADLHSENRRLQRLVDGERDD